MYGYNRTKHLNCRLYKNILEEVVCMLENEVFHCTLTFTELKTIF